MKKFFLINILLVIFFSVICYSQNDYEKIYSIIKKRPQTSISLLGDSVQVVNIYKQQIISIFESRKSSEEERINQFIDDVYFPYQEFWNNLFDENGFKKWIHKNWAKFQDINSPGFLIPFKIDFDSLFIATVTKVNKLTSRKPVGKWYLVYGTKVSNMGGFYNGDMFVDFFGIGNNGTEHLIFNLPHEINHQIFSKFNIDDRTLLYTILDEGFACYVNYLYWNKKFSPAKNINFTDEEWDWCIENEKKIFNFTKTYLDSTDRKIIYKFQRANDYIFEGAPDRIAYFIGFRICQAFVVEKGVESWKKIYQLSPREILELSGYQRLISK